MKIKKVMLSVAFMFCLFSCENPKASSQTELEATDQEQKAVHQDKIDTTNAVNIGGYWAKPNKSFEFNSLGSSTGDTLLLVTCGDYVFSPFGEINNESQLNGSLLKNFAITNRVDTMDVGAYEFQIMNLKDSRLITFFDDDPEASRRSYVFKGEINDSEVNLAKGVKVGMKKKDFLSTFFESFPSELLGKYNHIVFESCVTDIWHTYTFSNEELKSIRFKTDSYWTVNYEK